MNAVMKRVMKNQKGLTLVELLAVIVILGIIAAIAIPSIGTIIENSKTNAKQQSVLLIRDAAHLYHLENPGDTEITISDLTGGGYLQEAPKIPGSSTELNVTITVSDKGVVTVTPTN